RILDDVKRVITAESSVDARSGAKESASGNVGTESSVDASTSAEESAVSTDGGEASTTTVEAENVLAIVNELPDNLADTTLPQQIVDEKIVQVVEDGDSEVVEAYRESVLSQVNAEPHPHRGHLYITEEYRESHDLYADMDRDEREVMLRRYAARDAADRQMLKAEFTYSDVQELFKDYAGGGEPSPQYAYDLMDGAADEHGFEYAEFRGTKKLRVDLSEVSASIRGYVAEKGLEADLDALGVNGRLEDYDPNWQTANGEAAADD
ncbi:MAG: hypothetical protein ABEI57_00620, partial [Halapricum sp.]